MEKKQRYSNRLKLSVLADQLTSSVGGGRFLRGFLSALLNDPAMKELFDHVYLLVTQGESIECLGALPPGVSVIYRRFPNRLRHTLFNRLVKYTLPAVDVAYGPFYYVFPGSVRGRVVTLHDLSIFNQQFHPPIHARKQSALVERMVHECDGVVCISNDVLSEFKSRWPHLAHKATMIYNGVSAMGIQPLNAKTDHEHSILAVGTIEPRKNYPLLIDAFERLVHELGDTAPMLTVVGKMGWMSESVERRLLALQAAGRCRWLQNASDEELNEAYGKAGVFSFLSLSEGFGYPPFEAAFARCPMVLSKASSVGEIWTGHAKCVDPHDVEEIVAAWKWALELTPQQRDAVAATQERRAREFTWSRAIHEYIAFWNRLLNKDGGEAERFSETLGRGASPAERTENAPDVSIIIISYNTAALLRKCLLSVRQKIHSLSYEIIVVDNASIDTSCEMVETEFPEVHLIRNTENAGFSKANNMAIKEARGDYVLLLNSDAFLENNAAGVMHDFMQAHPRAGVCGPLLLNTDTTVQRSMEAHLTVRSMILRRTLGLNVNRAKWLLPDKYHVEAFPYSTKRYRITDGWLTGAVLMIRKDVFPEVGFFDEAYHFFNEDADWGLAISRSRWETWFIPEAVVTHIQGGSTKAGTQDQEIEFQVRCLRQNRYYIRKNLGGVRYRVYCFVEIFCFVINIVRRAIMVAASSPVKRSNAIFKKRVAWRLFVASLNIRGTK